MKGNGNGVSTILRKLYFFCLPTCGMRNRYIMKHKKLFHHIGNKIMWQSRKFPADPEFISIGDNVKIASNVSFTNHDVIQKMLNDMMQTDTFQKNQGCIKIGNNVMIGARTMILPNVCIGDNCVIGGGSIVTKDIPAGSVAAGVPAKVIGTIDKLIAKRKQVVYHSDAMKYWEDFYAQRKI